MCLISSNQGQPRHKDAVSGGAGGRVWQEGVEALHAGHGNGLPVRYGCGGSAAIPSPDVLDPEPVASRHRAKKKTKTEQTVLAPCWAGCTRQQLCFHRNWMYISHVCLVFLWQLVRFYLMFLLIHLLLVLE